MYISPWSSRHLRNTLIYKFLENKLTEQRVPIGKKSLFLISYLTSKLLHLTNSERNIISPRSTGQLRNTLSRARELCERWRSGGNAPAPPAPPPDDEGGGRLARWFSVRRGSAHQYDMHTHETDKMPKLPEVGILTYDCELGPTLHHP